MSILIYIIICILIIINVVFYTLALVAYRNANACVSHSNPWCYTDWKCNAPSGEALTQMISGGLLPAGTLPGTEYDLKTTIFEPILNMCNTANVFLPDGTVDPSKVTSIDAITGVSPCTTGPNCKTIPKGCTLDLYSNIITYDQVWGIPTVI